MWSAVHHPLARCRTSIESCEACIDAGFVEKFKLTYFPRRDFFLERPSIPLNARCSALAGIERLFFRGSFSRINSRHIMLGSDVSLVFWVTWSHNSCKVASGCSCTAARMMVAAGAKVRETPPACGKGAQLPVARLRASQRSTEGSLTWNRSAAAEIVNLPRSTLATTRWRRSVEYGCIRSILPSIH